MVVSYFPAELIQELLKFVTFLRFYCLLIAFWKHVFGNIDVIVGVGFKRKHSPVPAYLPKKAYFLFNKIKQMNNCGATNKTVGSHRL